MAAGDLVGAPRRVGLGPRVELVEVRVGVVRRADVAFLRDALARAGEPDRLERDADRLRGLLGVDPGAVVLVHVPGARRRRRARDIAFLARARDLGLAALGV